MKRIALAIAALFLFLATAAQGAERYDPAALAKTIEPYIDDATLFVTHVDMTRADLAPLAAKLKELFPKIGTPQQQAGVLASFDEGVDTARKWVADFVKA